MVLLRLTVTSGLVAVLLSGGTGRKAWESLREAAPAGVVAALLVMIAGILVSAWKWRMILGSDDVRVPLSLLVRTNFAAMFVNNFLPTSIGGDAYRIVRVGKHVAGRSTVLVTVLVERATGFWALLLLAWCSSVLHAISPGDPTSRAIAVYGSVPAALLALAPIAAHRVSPPHRPPVRSESGRGLSNLAASWASIRGRPHTLRRVLAISLGFHLLSGLGVWCLMYAVGIAAEPTVAFVIMAGSQIASLVPIAINGFGVAEASFVGLAALYGFDASTALAAAAIGRGLLLVVGLLGAFAYATDAGRRDPT